MCLEASVEGLIDRKQMELENRMVSEQLDLYIITDDIIASLIQAQVGQIARDEVKLCTLVQEAYDNFVQ